MAQIILGLGCNLGNRENNLREAIKLLETELLDNVIESSIYETPPLLPENAPDSWKINYLNVVIAGNLKVAITPEEFLVKIKEYEASLGRKPTERWAPREIDIDILFWSDMVYESQSLCIPHTALLQREFVVKPLLELFPDLLHPKEKDYIRNLYKPD